MQGDVGIEISGDIESPNSQEKSTLSNGLDFLQLPQLQFTQLGYPQAQQWLQTRKATLRPWSLFLSTNNFRAPPSVARIGKRIVKNIEYFQSNYLFVFIGLIIYCLISSPLLLLTVVASLFLCYKVSQRHVKQELILLNHKLTLAQVYAIVGICSLPMLYLVGAGAVLFWVLGVSCSLIAIHSTFYNIDSILCPGEDELNALVMQEV